MVIARFIGRDPENPCLQAAASGERLDILYDSEKSFLANLLRILAHEIGRQLENESGGGGIMQIEQLIPSRRFALPATGN
jgi:hypothetical protein